MKEGYPTKADSILITKKTGDQSVPHKNSNFACQKKEAKSYNQPENL